MRLYVHSAVSATGYSRFLANRLWDLDYSLLRASPLSAQSAARSVHGDVRAAEAMRDLS